MAANFLRYPGGKSKVVNLLLPFICSFMDGNRDYCEPFVGGGSVAIAIAETYPNIKLWLNDADKGVAAVWQVLAKGRQVNCLVDALCGMTPSVALFRRLRDDKPRRFIDRAARYIALNRMSFSGKAHTTPIGGWHQTGEWKIDAEWRIEHVTLNIRRAADILSTHEVVVTCGDFVAAVRLGALLYLDPPYYHRGPSMYPVSMGAERHEELAALLCHAKRWVLSYDDCPEVRKMYKGCYIKRLSWTYSAGSAPTDGHELVITKNESLDKRTP